MTGAWHAPVNTVKENAVWGNKWQEPDFSHKPSAFESEIHPSHKSKICTLCISPLQGADIRNPLRYLLMNAAASQYSERASLYKHLQCLPAFKCCRICAHVGYGNEFVNGHLCVHSQWHNHHHFSKKGGNVYCKKFIYTDVKIDKFKRQD